MAAGFFTYLQCRVRQRKVFCRRVIYIQRTVTRQVRGIGLSRAFDLSGFVARNLSGCPIARGGRYEADKSATGDTEDEIRGSV